MKYILELILENRSLWSREDVFNFKYIYPHKSNSPESKIKKKSLFETSMCLVRILNLETLDIKRSYLYHTL